MAQAPCIFTGDKAGPRILLLHGFLGHPEDWAATWSHAGGRGTWVAPWLPGHGEDPSPVDLRSLYESVCSLAGTEPFDLCVGYSMGGRLAMALQRWPTPWKRLVLVSADPKQPPRSLERFATDLQRAHDLVQLGLDAFVEHWYTQPMFAGMQPRTEFLARRRVHRADRLAEVVWRWSPARLRQFTSPLPHRVILGACDPGMQHYYHTEQVSAQYDTHVIPDVSHHLPEMAPAALCTQLLEALA